MINKSFVGRDSYINILKSKDYGTKSTITALYGRRRIGKTSLVEHVFKNKRLIKFEGLENASEQEQRENFANTLYRYSGLKEHTLLDTSDWTKLLIALSHYIDNTPTVIFFDEYQWLSAEKSKLTSYLKFVWDNYFLKSNKVHLIICGSISSFIVRKVIQSKALYGRIDTFIELKELTLIETINNFFGSKIDQKNILNYYLAVGGVPKYLELFDRNKSFEQNIESLCFTQSGYLVDEVDRLFVSTFGKNSSYKKIIQFLAKCSHASQIEIHKKLRLSSGGRLTTILDDLEYAGFIDCYTPVLKNEQSKLKRYRLRDPYLRFYFKFIQPNLKNIKKSNVGLSFSLLIKQSELDIWKGLTYENCIREHSSLIAKILGFSGIMYSTGSWYKKDDVKTGFQVDLIFIRKDKIITLCEIKYSSNINSKVMSEIQEKEKRIMEELKPDGIQKVLITVDPIDNSINRLGICDRIISLKDLISYTTNPAHL